MAPVVETIVALICLGPHDVGLSVKPGRLMSTLIDRNRTGTPFTIVGSGSDTTVICASTGSTWMACRTTTIPRSNGPAITRTAVDSPNGAPLYGPVSDTEPSMKNGFEPGPAPTVAVPTRDSIPHVPAFARSSGHSGMSFSFPISPGGISIVRPLMYCWRSGRLMRTANGEKAPPTGFIVPAWNDGANSPMSGVHWTLKESVRCTRCPAQEDNVASTVLGPQSGGIASGARGPSLNWSEIVDTGSCGFPAKV